MINKEPFYLSDKQRLILGCSTYGLIPPSSKDIFEDIEISNLYLDYVTDFLYKNKMTNLFVFNCESMGLFDILPDNFRQFVISSKEEMITNYIRINKEIVRVTEKCINMGFDIAFLKGISISELVYKDNPWARYFGDIDLLVNERQADSLFNLLVDELGYKCDVCEQEKYIYKTMFQHYAPINKDGIWVEIHQRITQKDDGYSIDTKKLLDEKVTMDIDGVKIPVLSVENILLNQCYHMFQHEYRETRYMLKLPADIFNFLINQKIDWARFIGIVKDMGLEFPVCYSLYNTNWLYYKYFGVNAVPDGIIESLKPEDFELRKDYIVSRHLFTNGPIGVWEEEYDERIFTDLKVTRNKLCKYAFIHFTEEAWKNECKRYGIDYKDVYTFTPKIWVDLGRL